VATCTPCQVALILATPTIFLVSPNHLALI